VALVAKACQIIESSESSLKLEELARTVGLSAHHFHRLFRRITGLTPKAYGQACQDQRVQQQLNTGKPVTEAIYDSGFESASPFYSRAIRILGMQPRDYRSGGNRADICFAVAESSLGPVLVAATTVGVCAVLFGGGAECLLHDLENRFPKARLIGGDADFEQLVAKVVAYVERPEGELDVPLDIRGTVFQRRVWRALLDLPFGETCSYQEIAKRIGSPRSYRAVANACAGNCLAVLVPCHRVVHADGSPGGYRWGLERKRELLRREVGPPD
jgi:AraC family transcriptional regulator of adaptative response/methylated-DNA-[protein]-cysteine methyltransferase